MYSTRVIGFDLTADIIDIVFCAETVLCSRNMITEDAGVRNTNLGNSRVSDFWMVKKEKCPLYGIHRLRLKFLKCLILWRKGLDSYAE